MSELAEATLRSDYAGMKKAIASGDNLNELIGGMPPLHRALFRGDVDAVRLLLESGADPNLRPNPTDSPLWHAEDDFGLFEIAKLLKAHGAVK